MVILMRPRLLSRARFTDHALFLLFFVFRPNGSISIPFVIEPSKDCLINPLACHEFKYSPPKPINQYIFGLWHYMCKFGMAASCAHSIMTIYKHMIATKQNYKDAIEIKNLLMKSNVEVS